MSNHQDQIPEYRVLVRSFIAPHLLEPGARIRTTAKPHNGWQPLNQAAVAALEAWYEEEYPAKDEKFKPIIGPDGKQVMVKPHAMFKPNEYGVVERPEEHKVQVLAIPDPRAAANPYGLAESLFGRRPDTDPRPGPAVPADFSKEIVLEQPTDFTGATTVLDAPNPDPRKKS